MKMGTIASPWRYDAAARHALHSANRRRPVILHYASRAGVFPFFNVVRFPFDSGWADQSRDRRDVSEAYMRVPAYFAFPRGGRAEVKVEARLVARWIDDNRPDGKIGVVTEKIATGDRRRPPDKVSRQLTKKILEGRPDSSRATLDG